MGVAMGECAECERRKQVLRQFLAAEALVGSAKIGLGPYKHSVNDAVRLRIAAWTAAMDVAAEPGEDIFDLMGTPECEAGEMRF